MEGLEWEGVWFLPDQLDDSVSGTLRQTDFGFELDLHGSLKIPEGELLMCAHGKRSPSIVHGRSRTGKVLTVAVISTRKQRWNKVYGEQISYRVGRVLEGQFLSSEDPEIFSLEFVLEGLLDWTTRGGVQDFKENGSFDFAYDRPSPHVLFDNHDFTVGILFWCAIRTNGWSGLLREVTMNPRANLIIDAKTPRKLSEFHSKVEQLKAFFSFAFSSPITISRFDGYMKRDESKSFGVNLSDKMKIYPSVSYGNKGGGERHHASGMLFTLEDVNKVSADVFGKWFKKYKKLSVVIGLYLGARETSYAEHRFLSLVQALECFHTTIRNRNRVPLKKRLDELLADARTVSSVAIALGNVEHSGRRFSDFVKECRHGLSHGNLDLEVFSSEAVKVSDLDTGDWDYMSRLMALLLEYLILSEIGFSSQVIEELLERQGSQKVKSIRYQSIKSIFR